MKNTKLSLFLTFSLATSAVFANSQTLQPKNTNSLASSIYSTTTAVGDFTNQNRRGIMLALYGLSFLNPAWTTYQTSLAAATVLSFLPADIFWGSVTSLASVNYAARTGNGYGNTSPIVQFNNNPSEFSKNAITSIVNFMRNVWHPQQPSF
ncbi:MAG: hypothetical protein JKY15_04905 [Deltaproteobacteria bacterium]|nr:hypothetical protein [Deltaproteobacteria bacterium]